MVGMSLRAKSKQFFIKDKILLNRYTQYSNIKKLHPQDESHSGKVKQR